jgi:hypothetical protein
VFASCDLVDRSRSFGEQAIHEITRNKHEQNTLTRLTIGSDGAPYGTLPLGSTKWIAHTLDVKHQAATERDDE